MVQRLVLYTLPVLRAQVQALVGELKPHKLHGTVKKINKSRNLKINKIKMGQENIKIQVTEK